MKKVVLCIVLILCLLLSGCAAAPAKDAAQAPISTEAPDEPQFRDFTDSTGRTLSIPAKVERIAVSGPLSQVYIIPIAADMMVGVSNAFSSDAELYLPDYIINAKEIGQLYGGKGEMDLEALLTAAPDVVIDVGETKSSTKEDLQALTEQTGIPFVHIYSTVDTAPAAERMAAASSALPISSHRITSGARVRVAISIPLPSG